MCFENPTWRSRVFLEVRRKKNDLLLQKSRHGIWMTRRLPKFCIWVIEISIILVRYAYCLPRVKTPESGNDCKNYIGSLFICLILLSRYPKTAAIFISHAYFFPPCSQSWNSASTSYSSYASEFSMKRPTASCIKNGYTWDQKIDLQLNLYFIGNFN